jgi:hypothetical protein
MYLYFPSKMKIPNALDQDHQISSEQQSSTIKSTYLLLPLRVFDSLLNNITHERATQQDRRLVQIMMLIAQRSHSSSFQDQTRVIRDVLANPAARERSQEVTVGYDQHVEGLVHAAFRLADGVLVEALAYVVDNGVAASGDVGGGSGRLGVSCLVLFLLLLLGSDSGFLGYGFPTE